MKKKTKDEDLLKEKEFEETADSNLDAVQDILDEQSMETKDDDLREQLQVLKANNEELCNKYLRLSADFQNYKKRVEKEKSELCSFANEKFILELLPIIDNLERAFKSTKDEVYGDSLFKGIEMIQLQFLDILCKNGIKEISAVGEPFDPCCHHAVLQEKHPDYEENIIIDVFQKGYTLNDKVIRPSMVKVSN